MSLQVEYESEYLIYTNEEFTITPTFIQGNPTSFIVNYNNKLYISSLNIDQTTGKITGVIKDTYLIFTNIVPITVQMSNENETIQTNFNIVLRQSLYFYSNYCSYFDDTTVIYNILQGTTSLNLCMWGFGYNPTFSFSKAEPYLLKNLRWYNKQKIYVIDDNTFGWKFYIKDSADEVGSCSYDITIYGGPDDNRKSLTKNVIINVYPKPDLEYEKYNYTFFTNKDFEIVPTQLIDNPAIKSISQQNNLQFDSSSCIISGNYSEPISFSPYFNVQSPINILGRESPASIPWNKKTLNINVINPILEYPSQDIYVNTESKIEPTSNSTILNNSKFEISDVILLRNTPRLFANEDQSNIDESGNINLIQTALGTYSKNITLTTYDDYGNEEIITATATYNVIPPTLNYDSVSLYMGETVNSPAIISGSLNSFKIIEGTLPTGLSLDPVTGDISGRLEEMGTFTITIEGNDGSEVGTATGTIVIESKDPTITSLKYNNINVIINTNVNISPVNDGYAIKYEITDGTLPDGLQIDPVTGIISGSVSEMTLADVTVTATSMINSVSTSVNIRIARVKIITILM